MTATRRDKRPGRVGLSHPGTIGKRFGTYVLQYWFGTLTEKQTRRGVHRSAVQLEAAILRYIAEGNRHPKPFVWTKTADEILTSVARFCQRISDSGH